MPWSSPHHLPPSRIQDARGHLLASKCLLLFGLGTWVQERVLRPAGTEELVDPGLGLHEAGPEGGGAGGLLTTERNSGTWVEIKTLEVPTTLMNGCAGSEAKGKLQTRKGVVQWLQSGIPGLQMSRCWRCGQDPPGGHVRGSLNGGCRWRPPGWGIQGAIRAKCARSSTGTLSPQDDASV